MPGFVPVIVAVVALVAGVFTLFASQLYVTPDSSAYINLAAGIAERLDFDNEWFVIRSYGYPVFLAAIFRLFGSASPTAILILQHGMVVACAVLTSLIAWTLWPQRGFALLAGLLGAFSFYLRGYANAVLTEVPYTFALTVCVFLLLRFCVGGDWRRLAGASAVAGVAALIRPTGQLMLGVCLMAALYRAWVDRGRPISNRRGPLTTWAPSRLLLAVVPGFVVILPALVHNYNMQGYFELCCTGKSAWYTRTARVERLDSNQSEALAKIKQTLTEARSRGIIDDSLTYQHAEVVMRVYREIHGVSWGGAAEALYLAGRDLAFENPTLMIRRTFVHAYRTLMIPDYAYRFQPGGSPGRVRGLATGATTFAVDTYLPMVVGRVGEVTMSRYTPISNETTAATPLLARMTQWYHGRIERGPPLVGLLDTPYEEFVLLCILGGAMSLLRPNRFLWVILGFVVFFHVFASATLLGTMPRYAVPIHPMIHLLAAFALLAPVHAAGWCVRGARGRTTRADCMQPRPTGSQVLTLKSR